MDGRNAALEKYATGQLGRLDRNTTPINGDNARLRTNRVVKESNANVRTALPGRAWTVMSMVGHGGLTRSQPSERLPLTDYRLHETFLAKEAACVKATQVAQDLRSQMPGGELMEVPEGMMQGASAAEVKMITVNRPPLGDREFINVAVYHTDWTQLHADSERTMNLQTLQTT